MNTMTTNVSNNTIKQYIIFYNHRTLTRERNRIKAVKTEIVNGINELINAKAANNKYRTIMRYALFVK